MAVNKYITNSSGVLVELTAPTTSAGSEDAGKIPALNASGILDATIVNSKTTSSGSGDSGKLAALDSSGKLDTSFMPTGIGADTASIVTSENLSAGNYVNIWSNGGVFTARKADATIAGKEAHGFVLASTTSPASAVVYFEGSNTGVAAQTPGNVFLSVTAGTGSASAPTSSGNVVQRLGFATSATVVNFQSQPPITLA